MSVKCILQFTEINYHHPICHKSFFLFHQLHHFLSTFFKLPWRKMQARKGASEWATVSWNPSGYLKFSTTDHYAIRKECNVFLKCVGALRNILFFLNMCVWVNNFNSNDYLIILLYYFFILKNVLNKYKFSV